MRGLMISLVLLAASVANAAPTSPSPIEFVKALAEFTGKPVAIGDIRRISCRGIEQEPTEAECTWQQKSGKKWMRFSAYIAVDGDGWHLIDDPRLIH